MFSSTSAILHPNKVDRLCNKVGFFLRTLTYLDRFFDGAPLIRVPGRMHPVEVRYVPTAPGDDIHEVMRFVRDRILLALLLYQQTARGIIWKLPRFSNRNLTASVHVGFDSLGQNGQTGKVF